MNRLRGMGSAIKGIFHREAGKADVQEKKEDTLTEESRRPPRQAPRSQLQVQQIELTRSGLDTFGSNLENRRATMNKVATKVKSALNEADPSESSAPANLTKQRGKVVQLATGMVEDLDAFCTSPLNIALSSALSGIDFKAADWEQTLKTDFKTQLEQGGYPSDASARMADWVFDQILTTGSVCMAALETQDDHVFGEYVKLAAGTVDEASGCFQQEGYIANLLSVPKDNWTAGKDELVKAFCKQVEKIRERNKEGDGSSRQTEISSSSASHHSKLYVKKKKTDLSSGDKPAIGTPKVTSGLKLELETDGDSSKSEEKESLSETSSSQ